MKRSLILIVPILALVAIGWKVLLPRKAAPAPSASVVYPRPPYDPTRLTKTIAFYEERVRTDPKAAIESGLLSGFYSQRCRETGDIADAVRAEKMARHALQIRSSHNPGAWDDLAVALLAQHRFNDALTAAQTAWKIDSEDEQTQDLRIEIWTERGDYAEASKTLQAR